MYKEKLKDKKNKMNRKFFAVLIFIFTPLFLKNQGFSIYSQDKLTNINASWTTVLPGKVVYQPEVSSYGFAVMTDARDVEVFSNDGKLVWEKHLKKFNSPFFTFLKDDFLTVITDSGKHLALINPDGTELWNIDLDFKITDKPVSGRDGRFFIRGQDRLCCYTITGLRKWSIKTPVQSKLPPQTLTDGSLVVFLNEMQDHKTKALRITPFGEIIEEILFAGEVVTSITTPKGVLLTFTDGSCGLFDLITTDNQNQKIQNGVVEHKWLLQSDTKDKRNFFVLSQNKDKIIYINHRSSSIEIDYIDSSDGNIYQSFFVQNVQHSPTCFYNDDGVLIADKENAFFFNNNGKQLWAGKMPQKGSREYYNNLLFTTDNHFVLFGLNWSINAFRTSQISKKKNKQENPPKERENYNSYYKYDPGVYDLILYSNKINEEMIDDVRFKALSEGNYAKDETAWISNLMGYNYLYTNFLTLSNTTAVRVEKTVFETDMVGLEKMLYELSAFNSDVFTDQICLYLRKEKNRTLLHSLISGIAKNGYDSDYRILQTLSQFAKNLNPKDDLLLGDVCDAVYSICRIMGSEAINQYGKNIYSELLYPKYSSITRVKARESMKKLVESISSK